MGEKIKSIAIALFVIVVILSVVAFFAVLAFFNTLGLVMALEMIVVIGVSVASVGFETYLLCAFGEMFENVESVGRQTVKVLDEIKIIEHDLEYLVSGGKENRNTSDFNATYVEKLSKVKPMHFDD